MTPVTHDQFGTSSIRGDANPSPQLPRTITVGQYFLHLAVSENSPPKILRLLADNADIDQPNIRGDTPLHLAVRLKANECAKILLQAKANPSTPDKFSLLTPLMTAAKIGNSTIIPHLIDAKADPHKKNGQGKTALDLAINNHQMQTSDVLRTLVPGLNIRKPKSAMCCTIL